MMRATTRLRVRYADTDQMKFAYNGKYFEYFEVGRTELLRQNGLTYKAMEEQGYFLPVREVGIKYKNAAFYDEELEIETWMAQPPNPLLHIEHIIRSVERGVVICEGFVNLMFVRAETGRACKPAPYFLDAIKPFYETNKI